MNIKATDSAESGRYEGGRLREGEGKALARLLISSAAASVRDAMRMVDAKGRWLGRTHVVVAGF